MANQSHFAGLYVLKGLLQKGHTAYHKKIDEKIKKEDFGRYRKITTCILGDTFKFGKTTIIILGGMGRVLRSLNLSPNIIFSILLFFITYMLLSFYISVSFIHLRSQYQSQSKKIKQLEDSTYESKKDLINAEQHAANLKEYIETLENTEILSHVTPGHEQAPAAVDIENIKKEEPGDSGQLKSVDIEDFKVGKSDSGINIDFRLIKIKQEESSIKGYVHIFFMDRNNNLSKAWNDPYMDIKNQVSSNFRSGEPFLIQRFKNCHYGIKPDPNAGNEMPASVSLLVYDSSGILILKKTFDASHIS